MKICSIRFLIIYLVYILIPPVSCTVKKDTDYTTVENTGIERLYARFDSAQRNNDTALMRHVYSAEHFYLTSDTSRGLIKAEEHFKRIDAGMRQQRINNRPGGGISFCIVDRKIEGKYAFDIGYYKGYSLDNRGDTVLYYGKQVMIFRKEDNGEWKIYAESYNDCPPAVVKAANCLK